MPILIFTIQRLILLFLAIMTFLGITSDETYLNASDSYRIEKERKPAIVELLEKGDPVVIVEESDDGLLEKTGLDNMLDKINNEFPIFGQKEIISGEVEMVIAPKKTFDTEIQKNTNLLLQDIENDLEKIRLEVDKLSSEDSDLIEEVEEVEEKLSKPVFKIANTASNAVINIMCLSRVGNNISITTGSGVIISPKGTILTNGHVAQHLLQQNNDNVDCEIKHPNNLSMSYRAVISYIPSIWKGGGMLNLKEGKGESDYAFLSIVGPGPTGKIPVSFPYIPIETNSKEIEVGKSIFMLGYPSKQTGVYKKDTNLELVTDTSVIKDIFTFNKTSIDTFSSGVSPVAKQGSSGGAVLDGGKLIGLIVTTNEDQSGGSILNAITLSYIKNDLEDNGLSIDTFLK